MKTRPLAFALLLSLAPAAAAPPRVAFAQAADDATTKMARQRFQEGVAFYDKGQFEMARAAFLQAYALRKHPTVLLNLAQSSLKSGHALDAARYFQQFLKESSGISEAQRADATKGLGEARMKLGRIDVIGATVGADIFVDDERIGMAPLDHSVDVEPGSHTVRSQGPNGEQTIPVTASAGQGVVARFSAASSAPAASPPSPPPAPPPSEPAPEPTPSSTPSEPETSPPPAPPPSTVVIESRHHPWGWVLATSIITVAGFGVAAVMGAEKSSAQSNANSLATAIKNNYLATNGANSNPTGVCYQTPSTSIYATPCAELATDNNNVNTDATVANFGIGVGIAGAVGVVISVIVLVTSYGGSSESATPASGSSTTSMNVTPLLGKGQGGASFGFSF
jgi:hypothetical protein